MVGTYDLTVKAWHAPNTPTTTDTGTATRKMILGDPVMVEEVTSQMLGQPYSGPGLHGFDNVTGKCGSTWSDSMSTGLMVSEGSCDANVACTYTGSYHDPATSQSQNTRMTTRWTDNSTEVFEMHGSRPRWQGNQDDGNQLQEARAVKQHKVLSHGDFPRAQRLH